jgi:hypothetical protein
VSGPATFNRRRFLALAAAGAGTLVLARRGVAAPSTGARVVTEPDLEPPTLAVSTLTRPAPGYVFVSTLNGPGQRGPMIVDDHGSVVWFRPVDTVAINFRRQLYRGEPVLTWWEGTITPNGTGRGENVIVDSRYRTVARVGAGNGFRADVHEFLLTPQGTALMTVYDEREADLTALGGTASASVLDSIVQEVDVKTGAVVFEWHSLDHVPFADSFSPLLDPFDYFHVNSIDVDLDGNLLVSARNTSAIYKLDRKSGEVMWTLGGRASDFDVAADAAFMFQHDARGHSDGTLTLFDDGTGDLSHPARGLRLGLDVDARRCVLLQQYPHPTPLAVSAMGNAQVLPDNGMLVGFGTEPYVTEFGPAGDVRFEAQFVGGAWNYRAFRDTWVGRPADAPSVAVRHTATHTVVYASWNGSTETARWRVLAGDRAGSLRRVAEARRDGFETEVRHAGAPRFVAVEAIDDAGAVIGLSATRRV